MSRMFFGGIPTDSDVRRLIEAFPEIKPGDTIAYTDIAKVINADHGTSRFISVTGAWRRLLTRTQNFVMEAVPNQGFRRLTELERSQSNRIGWRKDQTRAARKVRDLARTDTRDFNDKQQSAHDHARRLLQAHVEHTASTVKELAPPTPQAQLPKRRGPT